MPRYRVMVFKRETVTATVEVEAENKEQAEELAIRIRDCEWRSPRVEEVWAGMPVRIDLPPKTLK